MATSDRRSRKADRKNKFERTKNEGKVAREKRASGTVNKNTAKFRRTEKRAAARTAAAEAATVARAAVDVAAHEAELAPAGGNAPVIEAAQ